MGVWYCTREDAARAADIKASAYMNADIDSAIESASRAIDGGNQIGGLLRRRFYPQIDTRYFDWPDRIAGSRTWRLWLDQHEVISTTGLVAGGVTISSNDYFLRPDYGPPFDRIEIDLSGSASFSSGNTHQRAIAVTGLFGYSDDSEPAGTISEDISSGVTSVDVSNSALIGVGHIIKVDDERMIVTDKTWLDTGVDIDAADSLTANDSDVVITLSSTTNAPVAGEKILIGGEIMDVLVVAGTSCTVRRAVDGSVLASHSGSASISAPRTLTVSRGALGTTAAAHSSAQAVTRHAVPGLVKELCLAYAINNLEQRSAAYARVAGSGDNAREFTGRGIRELEKDCKRSYGRQMLMGAV